MRRLAAVLMLSVLFSVAAIRGVRAQFYLIHLNTAELNGQTGNIDLQFNPGGADALAANAEVHSSQTDGMFRLPSDNTGASSGTLPGVVSIDNLQALNEHFQAMTFGNGIQMVVCFSGPALTPGVPFPFSGSTFSVSFYDDAGINPLLTTSPDGSVLHIELNPDGSFDTETFLDAAGVVHASITPLASCVPEPPAALSLGMLLGIGGCLVLRRRPGG